MEFIYQYKLYTSVALIVVILLIRYLLIRRFRKLSAEKKQDHRQAMNTIKNLFNLILIIVLFALWNAELQKFALSIAAFMVAIVIATREIIQCLIGLIYISSSQPFRIGDWIQTDTYTGEVTATDWAKITLLEVDIREYEYTGKSVFIPNSQLVTHPVKNLNFLRRYVNHHFLLYKDDDGVNPFEFKQTLLDRAAEYCSDFKEVAERYNTLIENRLGVKIPGPTPSIHITTSDLAKIQLTINIFCPTERAKAIEQQLTQDFFELWAKHKGLTKIDAPI